MKALKQTNVDEIVFLHREIMGLAWKGLKKAIRIGELLTAQKEALRHGEFGGWIADNLPFTDRTARNYMRVYRERDRLKTESVSVLTDGYKLLTERKTINDVQRAVYVIVNPSASDPLLFFFSVVVRDDNPCIVGTRRAVNLKAAEHVLRRIKRSLSPNDEVEFIYAEPIEYNALLFNSQKESNSSGGLFVTRDICNRCGGDPDLCTKPEIRLACSL